MLTGIIWGSGRRLAYLSKDSLSRLTVKGPLAQPQILKPETSTALAKVTAKAPAAGDSILSARAPNSRRRGQGQGGQDLADRKPGFESAFPQSH